MLSNLIIGLREGLEAALLVSILVTYLTRTSRTHLIRFVSFGVAGAVAFSVVVATILQVVSNDLSESIEPAFAGIVSFIAVGFVTWMIFWMKRTARTISGDLRAKLDLASTAGAGAVATMAFLAVAREGTETAVFFWAAAHATHNSLVAITGLILGLAISSALGVAFYKSTLKLNLTRFFTVTGVLLAFVAAGVLSYGIHEFQEIGWFPGEDNVAFTLPFLGSDSVVSSLFAGLLNVTEKTTVIQAVVWVLYSTIVIGTFLRASSTKSVGQSPAPVAVSQDSATQEPAHQSVR